MYELRGKLSYLIGNITLLQQNNWIDRNTRAIFIEFAAYNPNINLFVVTTMLIEMLPSGNMVKSRKFECINLMETSNPIVKILFMVVYMFFVLYFTLKAIKQFMKQGWAYLKGFWTLVDWILIIFSVISFNCFLQRIEKAAEISKYFIETKGYDYIKLQDVNLANQLIVITLSCCCAFQTIKFLQLLRFNNKIYMLALTLNHCIPKLGGFVLVFSVIWFAFVQLMYLFFNERSYAYADIVKSVTTSIQILLGKFEIGPLLQGNPLFGSILFMSYNILIVLLLMNTFISIICESFEAVRIDLEGKPNDFEIFDYFAGLFGRMSASIKAKTRRMRMEGLNLEDNDDEEEMSEYERLRAVTRNRHVVLSDRVDKLIDMCGIVSLCILSISACIKN